MKMSHNGDLSFQFDDSIFFDGNSNGRITTNKPIYKGTLSGPPSHVFDLDRAQPVPAPPSGLDDLYLSQIFKNNPAASDITASQFIPQSQYPDVGGNQDVVSRQHGSLNPNAASFPHRKQSSNHHNFSQGFSQQVGIVPPIQTKRLTKPIFKTPFRKGSINDSSEVNPSQHGSFTSNTRGNLQRYPSDEDLFESQNDSITSTPAYGQPSAGSQMYNRAAVYHDEPDTPRSLPVPGMTPGGNHKSTHNLRPVAELPYRRFFKFPYFNKVQSEILDDVLYSGQSLVISAPTGSGKTVILELAIIRLLMQKNSDMTVDNFKIVYMGPMKALCSERYEDWKTSFGSLGLKCKELTGDTEMDDYFELQEVDIVLTTPEKWDSMTRKWRDNKSLVQMVRLFLIDEVHLLNDEHRGATMEAVVSRMKTINSTVCKPVTAAVAESSTDDIRFIAVSATIPNVGDVAEWLGSEKGPAKFFKLNEKYRPVKLRKVVLGFSYSQNSSEFRFDMSLNYKLANVIHTYSDQKPTLVFCATRKGVQQASSTLLKDSKFILNSQHKQRLQSYANTLKEAKLRDSVVFGVGYHHAGLDVQDRKTIEKIFTQGELPVLIATSTLAMGVNLPAHLVVIKSTQHYNMGVYEEYSESQMLQMIGRAGRPQFDVSATAVIMTRTDTKSKYENLLDGTQQIESSLHKHLIEHLNAEIVLSTINDVTVALGWIKSTFLYIRVMKNPKHYGIPTGLTKDQVEKRLQELCLQNLNSLAKISLVKMDEDHFDMKPTETGRLMARYCVAYDTMKKYSDITGTESMSELLTLISSVKEFRDVKLRVNERKALNTLNKDKNRATIRFPMEGKIKTCEMKVNCLIQAQLGCLTVQDFSLSQDIGKIFRSGQRIVSCLVEVLSQGKNFKALLNAVLLSKCFKARLWENSKFVSKQLTGIGQSLSTALVNAGLIDFKKIEDKNPREIEMIVNRHPPFGNQVRDEVGILPKYELSIDQNSRYTENNAEITVTVTVANKQTMLEAGSKAQRGYSYLMIGDADNIVVFKAKISDSTLLKSEIWMRKINVKRPKRGEDLSVNLINLNYAGLDVQSSYTPFYIGRRFISSGDQTEQANELPPLKRRIADSVDTEIIQDFEDELGPGMKPCNHHCAQKQKCGHECCKVGIPIRKTPRQQTKAPSTPSRLIYSTGVRKDKMQDYMSELRSRAQSLLPHTPNMKRFKVTNEMELQDLNRFAYDPKLKEKMPATKSPGPVTPSKSASGWADLNLYCNHRQDYKDEPRQLQSVTPFTPSASVTDPYVTNTSDISSAEYGDFTMLDDVIDEYDFKSPSKRTQFVNEDFQENYSYPGKVPHQFYGGDEKMTCNGDREFSEQLPDIPHYERPYQRMQCNPRQPYPRQQQQTYTSKTNENKPQYHIQRQHHGSASWKAQVWPQEISYTDQNKDKTNHQQFAKNSPDLGEGLEMFDVPEDTSYMYENRETDDKDQYGDRGYRSKMFHAGSFQWKNRSHIGSSSLVYQDNGNDNFTEAKKEQCRDFISAKHLVPPVAQRPRTHISKTVDQVRENDKRCVVISDEDDDLLVSHLDSQEMELSNQQHQASQEYISKVSRQDNTCMVPRTDNMCMVPQKDKTCMVPQKDKTCMSQHYNSYRVSQQDNTYDKIGAIKLPETNLKTTEHLDDAISEHGLDQSANTNMFKGFFTSFPNRNSEETKAATMEYESIFDGIF